MRAVLELARRVNDQLDAVVAGVRFEGGRGSPFKGASVVNAGGDGCANRDDIGGWATEKENGNWAGGRGSPGNGIRLASGDEFIETRLVDWVAGWVTNWSVVG